MMNSRPLFITLIGLGVFGMFLRVLLTLLNVEGPIQTILMVASMALMVIGLTGAVIKDKPDDPKKKKRK